MRRHRGDSSLGAKMADINGPAMVVVYVGAILIAILDYPVVASVWLVLGFMWLVYLGRKSYD